MHVNWTEIPAVYLQLPLCVRLYMYVQYVCVWPGTVSYYSSNGLQRFGGYLFLLVNCEADTIGGLGEFEWAFCQITSVIVCAKVPGCSQQDRAREAPKFNGGGRSDPSFRQLTL